VLHINQIG